MASVWCWWWSINDKDETHNPILPPPSPPLDSSSQSPLSSPSSISQYISFLSEATIDPAEYNQVKKLEKSVLTLLKQIVRAEERCSHVLQPAMQQALSEATAYIQSCANEFPVRKMEIEEVTAELMESLGSRSDFQELEAKCKELLVKAEEAEKLIEEEIAKDNSGEWTKKNNGSEEGEGNEEGKKCEGFKEDEENETVKESNRYELNEDLSENEKPKRQVMLQRQAMIQHFIQMSRDVQEQILHFDDRFKAMVKKIMATKSRFREQLQRHERVLHRYHETFTKIMDTHQRLRWHYRFRRFCLVFFLVLFVVVVVANLKHTLRMGLTGMHDEV